SGSANHRVDRRHPSPRKSQRHARRLRPPSGKAVHAGGPHSRDPGLRGRTVMPSRLLSAAVAVAIAAFPLVPPEHVHEASDEHGRVHFYAHRHLAPDHANLPDKGATTLEDHDPLVTID